MLLTAAPANPRSRAAEWREHWPAAVGASLGVASGFSLYSYISSLFIEPLQHDFGWTRGELAAAHYTSIVSALFSPMAGRILDRLGLRGPIILSFLLLGLTYLSLSLQTGSLLQYYTMMMILQVVGMCTTGLAFTRIIAERFDAARGMALASTRIGLSLLGMIMPIVLHQLIVGSDWRTGFIGLATLALLVGLPVSILLLRDGSPGGSAVQRAGRTHLPLHKAFSDRRVVLLCLASAFGFAPLATVLSQLKPILTDNGLGNAEAALVSGVLAGSVLIGTLLSGALVDRIWAPLVAGLFSLGPCIGIALLMTGHNSLPLIVLALVLIGMSQGAEIDIVAYLAARYFGISRYSEIYGLNVLGMIMLSSLSQAMIGTLYDLFGGYRQALALCIAGLVISMICYLLLGPYPDRAAGQGEPA